MLGIDPSGNNPTAYVLFSGKRVARRDPGGAVFYDFADHLGSSRIVTNATGTILDDSDVYPFGGERVVTASSGKLTSSPATNAIPKPASTTERPVRIPSAGGPRKQRRTILGAGAAPLAKRKVDGARSKRSELSLTSLRSDEVYGSAARCCAQDEAHSVAGGPRAAGAMSRPGESAAPCSSFAW